MLQRTMLRASRQRIAAFAPLRQPLVTARVATTPALRWYSDAPAAKEGEAAEKKDDAAATPANDEASKLKTEMEKKDKEIVELKDKYLRSVADFRNLQERTKRETQAAKDFAIQRFARDLVESVDNLDRALGTVPADKLKPEDGNADLIALHDGIKMTDSILISTLKKHGLERFDPSDAGEKFNPNVHEAVFQAPQPDKEDGICFHTQQKGFLLNGRVLKAGQGWRG
ncbi:hypothetical protein SNOG_07532 [Parastagonospora nodorum SN15]|uniref:GrpE protein homolog, mitochondrial n=1 Tax=Phaeosphaeria nodorum (strain SN15 / ATCC MYA-4574 / FGSC 10173) TaxID=321614 RepID=Q0UL32_PHANO|nr:hypothetical protein SNOG_07532 [Parastagonospora nodorum SN15]EAT84998.1 hypothetical protein SNOG_07532 [Parastagonospora nodorum SN15]